MQFYECVCLCTAVAAATGILSSLVHGMNISVFSLVFAGMVMAAFGNFSFFPLPELRCNAAVLFLPCYLLLSARDAKGKNRFARNAWRTMFASSILPVIGTLLSALFELIYRDYASVDLGSVELRNAMVFFTAASFLLLRLQLTAQQRKQLV